MPEKELWRSSLEKSEQTFSEDKKVKESKENMYYNIMDNIFPDKVEVSYDDSQKTVQNLIEQQEDKKENTISWSNIRPIAVGSLGLVAAVFIFSFVNTSNLKRQLELSPPLKSQDFPPQISQEQQNFYSVSTNNDFFLGYAPEENSGGLDVLVHSRAADIDWNSLRATQDNLEVEPFSIDAEKNIISLPATESDIYFSIDDAKGNTIECIIPATI